MKWPGWGSLKAVEKVHFFFESLETISLAAAIVLELSGMRGISNAAWIVLVLADAGRGVYGRREKTLTDQSLKKEAGARLRIERQIGGRDITDAQRDLIAQKLSAYAGQRITICTFPTNGETMWFAFEVWRLLKQAGWMTERNMEPNFNSPIYTSG